MSDKATRAVAEEAAQKITDAWLPAWKPAEGQEDNLEVRQASDYMRFFTVQGTADIIEPLLHAGLSSEVINQRKLILALEAARSELDDMLHHVRDLAGAYMTPPRAKAYREALRRIEASREART